MDHGNHVKKLLGGEREVAEHKNIQSGIILYKHQNIVRK